jgi:hypothetical protein
MQCVPRRCWHHRNPGGKDKNFILTGTLESYRSEQKTAADAVTVIAVEGQLARSR